MLRRPVGFLLLVRRSLPGLGPDYFHRLLNNVNLYMSDSEPQKAKESSRTLWRQRSTRYKEKLERKPIRAAVPDVSVDNVAEVHDTAFDPKRLHTLVKRAQNGGAVFQSVVVAALQILDRAHCYEERAAEAALSLGQREKLQAMMATTDEVLSTLKATLSAQGAKVMDLCAEQRRDEPVPEDQSWWFVLTDALEILAEGAERMNSLTTSQPKGSPAHDLSAFVEQLLRAHHHELHLEAEQWIS